MLTVLYYIDLILCAGYKLLKVTRHMIYLTIVVKNNMRSNFSLVIIAWRVTIKVA